jgi:hypothetical protein
MEVSFYPSGEGCRAIHFQAGVGAVEPNAAAGPDHKLVRGPGLHVRSDGIGPDEAPIVARLSEMASGQAERSAVEFLYPPRIPEVGPLFVLLSPPAMKEEPAVGEMQLAAPPPMTE